MAKSTHRTSLAPTHDPLLALISFSATIIHQRLKINGAIHTFSTIVPCIVASAGEADYAALFAGAQHAASLRTILADLEHPQPPTVLM